MLCCCISSPVWDKIQQSHVHETAMHSQAERHDVVKTCRNLASAEIAGDALNLCSVVRLAQQGLLYK
jgi:hypothetical protein